MKKALLIIGDKKINIIRVNHSFEKFLKYAERSKLRQMEVKVISYAQLFSGKVPAIESSKIKVVFFFPYQYWNRQIEIYGDGRIYGDKRFGRQFQIFFSKVGHRLGRYYKGKRIEYLNSPKSCCLDRDKKASKDLLRRSKLPIPRAFAPQTFSDIKRIINRGTNLYLKPRFGAMGKGITYIDREQVVSNFLFRQGKIISRRGDYNWRFSRIQNARSFLNQLLKKDFICEEAITPPTFRGRRFDFRVYVIFGKVVYLYAKFSPAQSWVTNWSQGGKIDKKKAILNSFSKKKITQLKRLAKEAAQALRLNFAGIDIIFSHDLKKAYVLEGNAFPGYEKGFDLMKCLLGSL